MSNGRPPRGKQDHLEADNVEPPQYSNDGCYDLLSPLLEEEAATSPGDEPSPGGRRNVLSLLEENARLRALAVGLSNLVGNLPAQKWQDAVGS